MPKRRPKIPRQKRSHQYKALFNDEENIKLKQLCAGAHKKPGTWLRIRGLEIGKRKILHLGPELAKTLYHLGRIGNNLNQIAHHLNKGHVAEGVDTIALKSYLDKVLSELNAIRELIIEATRDDR